MVLAFRPTWNIELHREHALRGLSWALMAMMLAFFAWNFLSNPRPGPYGSCYGVHTQQTGCGQPTAGAASAVPLLTQRP